MIRSQRLILLAICLFVSGAAGLIYEVVWSRYLALFVGSSGIAHLVIPVSPEAALPSEAAYRVSEGGLEHVTIWRVGRLGAWLKELRASGYEVIGAATRGGRPDAMRTSSAPLALVLGNEETGMAPDVAAACNRLVTLPGTGKVESLNVSVASAVLIWEIFGRQAAK